jgi:hypothetical protein
MIFIISPILTYFYMESDIGIVLGFADAGTCRKRLGIILGIYQVNPVVMEELKMDDVHSVLVFSFVMTVAVLFLSM